MSETSKPADPVERNAAPSAGAGEASQFESLAQEPEPGLLKEFGWFLIENKAWWMVPILVVLGLLTALAWLMSTGAAPFIYPVF
jgi:hypothetical protein